MISQEKFDQMMGFLYKLSGDFYEVGDFLLSFLYINGEIDEQTFKQNLLLCNNPLKNSNQVDQKLRNLRRDALQETISGVIYGSQGKNKENNQY